MIAIRVGDPHSSGAQIAGRLGQRVSHGQGRTGNLEQNLRGERQRAAHSDQGAAGGNIKRGGELQKLLAFFVAAAHKHWYRDRETWPLTALCFRIQTLQTNPFWTRDNHLLAPWWPNQPVNRRQHGEETRTTPGNSGVTPRYS